jgi:diguanylate cyclase (GGDEF)-like protein
MKIHLVNYTKGALSAVKMSLEDFNVNLVTTKNIDEAFEKIKADIPRIIILNQGDYYMEIIDFCKKIRRLKKGKSIGILIITSKKNDSSFEKILKAGADDFIYRPFTGRELKLRFLRLKKGLTLNDELFKAKKKFIKCSSEDTLTGFLNRRTLLDNTLSELNHAVRKNTLTSAIIIRISNFIQVTEEYGSGIAKFLLHEFSKDLKKTCRPYDQIGRYGGYEFLIILTDSSIDQAEILGNRIKKNIFNKLMKIQDENINIKFCIGISELAPNDIAEDMRNEDFAMNDLILESFIRRAELACDKAEENGRDGVEVYTFD